MNKIQIHFTSKQDLSVFEENLDKNVFIKSPKKATLKKGIFFHRKPNYNQELEFWQILTLVLLSNSVPNIINALRSVVVKSLSNSVGSITIENNGRKITIQNTDLNNIDDLINEESIQNILSIKKDEEE